MATNTLEYLLKIKDEATAVLNKFGKSAQTTGKSVEKLGKGMTNAGMSMVKLGAVGVASLGLASKTAISFEDAFAGVRKTVDASEEEFKQLENNIRAIAKSAPVSVEELSRIGELAGQLGVEGVDNLTKFTKTVADISVSTNLTSEQASTAFAQIFNIMGESLDQVDKMGSAIVELGNNFATTESDITNFTQRIAGAGKIAGLSTADILGISTAMASVGIKAEAGGTAVQKVLLAMNEAVVTGGAELQTFADTVGVTTAEFKKGWDEDATKTFANFVKGLGKQGDEATLTLQDLGLANQRVITAFLSLANAGDLLDETLATASEGWSENSALTEEAEKRYKTTASQMQILRNTINDVGITLGSTLLPMINSVIQKLKPAIEAFTKFTEKHPKLVVGILAVVAGFAVLGTGLVILGSVISSVGVIMGAFGVITLAVTWPMVAIAVAIGAVIAIGVLLYKNWDKIKAGAKQLGSAIKAGVLDGVNKMKKGFEDAKKNIENFMSSLSSGASKAGGSMKTFFVNMITGAEQGIKSLFAKIRDIFNGAIALIFQGDFKGEFGRALGISEDSDIIIGFLGFRDKVIEIFNMLVAGIQLAMQPYIWMWENVVFPILYLAFAIISRVLFEIYNVFVTVFGFIKDFVISVLTDMWQGMVIVFTAIKDFIFMIMTTLWEEVLLPIFTLIRDGFLLLWNTIKEATLMVWTSIKEFFILLGEELFAIFSGIWESVVQIFTSLWETVKLLWAGIAYSITEWATKIKTVLDERITKAKEIVINIFTALWNGIKSIGEKIYNAIIDPFVRALRKIEEVAQKIKDTAKKISPFHKSSPSLVELVTTGVGKIKKEYASLNNISIPSAQDLAGVNSFAPLTRQIDGAESGGSNVTNNFNVDAVINSEMDAEELALILGAQLATAKAY